MLHTEKYLENHGKKTFYEVKALHHAAVVVFVPHLQKALIYSQSKFWKLEQSGSTLKFVAVEKLNGRRAGFVAAVRFIL